MTKIHGWLGAVTFTCKPVHCLKNDLAAISMNMIKINPKRFDMIGCVLFLVTICITRNNNINIHPQDSRFLFVHETLKLGLHIMSEKWMIISAVEVLVSMLTDTIAFTCQCLLKCFSCFFVIYTDAVRTVFVCFEEIKKEPRS